MERRNAKFEICPYSGLSGARVDNYAPECLRGFCNRILAFCNGILQRHGDSDIAKQSRKGLAPLMAGATRAFCNGIAKRKAIGK